MKLEPLVFEPKLVPKIWGGQSLAKLGKSLPSQDLGESWELYDLPGDSACVAEGSFKGQTLNQILSEWGHALLGESSVTGLPAYFPLMVKFIDAREDLSVQVHPDDDLAAQLVGPDALGKSEMWVVLSAEPGAQLCAGFQKGVDQRSYLEAVKQGKVESLLRRFAVQAGDVINIPAGRVHAIGAGCRVAEIQQNSDTTYRVWDYGRLENGKPRALHLDQALRCLRFDPEMAALPDKVSPQKVESNSAERELLLQSPYFKVERLKLKGRFSPPAAASGFHILMILEGQARLESPGLSGMMVPAGQTRLLPASLGWSLEGEGATLLWVRP